MTDKQPEEELHPAVQLLLKRMDSNPEEFLRGAGGEWQRIRDDYERYFTKAETAALDAGQNKIAKDVMYRRVMQELLDPKPGVVVDDPRTYQNILDEYRTTQPPPPLPKNWTGF